MNLCSRAKALPVDIKITDQMHSDPTKEIFMKELKLQTILATLIGLSMSFTASAGGGSSGPTSKCSPAETVVLRQATVMDRGLNPMPYSIQIESQKCVRGEEKFVSKYMYIKYKAPLVRQGSYGIVFGETIIWSGMNYSIFSAPKSRLHNSTVDENGISLQIAGASFPGHDVELVPPALKADKATGITIMGDAFLTHTITGPFDR